MRVVDGQTFDLGYDAENRLASVTQTGLSQIAAFGYDGDGKRVKSVMNGTERAYFVGTHYEVTGEVATKYYYAGTQRIAMRNETGVLYLFSDHLGSTSLTVDPSGTVVSEQRYKAWGEARFGSGTMPTDYTYTGQYSYTSDFGLMYYNARWYDPSLGRFNQPDTIILEESQGVQSRFIALKTDSKGCTEFRRLMICLLGSIMKRVR